VSRPDRSEPWRASLPGESPRRTAEVSIDTLYRYFPSKSLLLESHLYEEPWKFSASWQPLDEGDVLEAMGERLVLDAWWSITVSVVTGAGLIERGEQQVKLAVRPLLAPSLDAGPATPRP